VCLFVLLFMSWGGWVDMGCVRGSVFSHVLASSMNAFRSCFILSVDQVTNIGLSVLVLQVV
jgi:hypothetical protein